MSEGVRVKTLKVGNNSIFGGEWSGDWQKLFTECHKSDNI